jgi:hypothetical protein
MVTISQQAKEDLIRDAVVTYIKEKADDREVDELIADLRRLIAGLDEALAPPSVPRDPGLDA